mgnify:CR=1 FL=1
MGREWKIIVGCLVVVNLGLLTMLYFREPVVPDPTTVAMTPETEASSTPTQTEVNATHAARVTNALEGWAWGAVADEIRTWKEDPAVIDSYYDDIGIQARESVLKGADRRFRPDGLPGDERGLCSEVKLSGTGKTIDVAPLRHVAELFLELGFDDGLTVWWVMYANIVHQKLGLEFKPEGLNRSIGGPMTRAALDKQLCAEHWRKPPAVRPAVIKKKEWCPADDFALPPIIIF